jgi:hypothetical protein
VNVVCWKSVVLKDEDTLQDSMASVPSGVCLIMESICERSKKLDASMESSRDSSEISSRRLLLRRVLPVRISSGYSKVASITLFIGWGLLHHEPLQDN